MSMIKHKPSRRSKDEAKHEAILKAAIKLFLKNGYSNTSMDAVAEAARVTKQTVYAHYESKDKLFTTMLSHLCEKHVPVVQLNKLKNQSLEQALYNIGMAFLNTVTTPEVLALTKLVIAEGAKHPKIASQYYDGGTLLMVNVLSDFLKFYVDNNTLHINSTRSAASYFIALLKGQYYIRMMLGVKTSATAADKQFHVKETVQAFLRIYGGTSPLQTESSL